MSLTGLARRKANTRAGALDLLERKRLELARALATRPRVLLLDEIAGGLTERELPELIALVRRINGEGVAIVWIEHIVHALRSVVEPPRRHRRRTGPGRRRRTTSWPTRRCSASTSGIDVQ